MAIYFGSRCTDTLQYNQVVYALTQMERAELKWKGLRQIAWYMPVVLLVLKHPSYYQNQHCKWHWIRST